MSFKDLSGNKQTETVVSALKVPTGCAGSGLIASLLAVCLQRLGYLSGWSVGLKESVSLQSSLGCKSPEALLCILFLRLPCIVSLTMEQSCSPVPSSKEASGVAAVINLISW